MIQFVKHEPETALRREMKTLFYFYYFIIIMYVYLLLTSLDACLRNDSPCKTDWAVKATKAQSGHNKQEQTPTKTGRTETRHHG